MEQPRIRLGNADVWLELARTGGDSWQITADWCSWLTADFTADLSAAEAVDFVGRMLSHLRAPSGGRFSAAVTPGRNNPLTLHAEPGGDGFALFVRLTPNGDDDVCHLQMEVDPIATLELREAFNTLHAALMSDRLERFGQAAVSSRRPPQRMPFASTAVLSPRAVTH